MEKYNYLTGRKWQETGEDCIMRSFVNLYASPNIVRFIKSIMVRWARHLARMGEMRNACNILGGKSERKRSLGRPRRGWEDNIRMDLREIGRKVWTGLTWLRLGTNGGLFLLTRY
jgi:hypothetical protein